VTRYIVTVNPPIFVSVEAPDEDAAKEAARELYFAERVDLMIQAAVDKAGFGMGDVDLFDSYDTTVSVDESEQAWEDLG
jgi:hypothetical protein